MNVIEVSGEIGWDITAREIKTQLNGMRGDITVEINSVGGSITQGVEIFNALFAYDRGQITTVNTGLCASMASYILLVGDTIKAYDNSIYMVHNALTFEYGNQHAMRKTADRLESLSNMLGALYVSKTGKSQSDIAQMMDDETYLFGDEMLSEGFVDEMITISDTNEDKASLKVTLLDTMGIIQASAKEHCKNEGYCNFEKIVASMPTEEPTVAVVNNKLEKNHIKDDNMEKNIIAQADFEAVKVDLTSATATISQLEVDNAKLVGDIESLNAKLAVKPEIMAMAYTHNVSQEVAVKMLEKDTLADAGLLALDAKATTQATIVPKDVEDAKEAQATADDSAMKAYADKNKGRIK